SAGFTDPQSGVGLDGSLSVSEICNSRSQNQSRQLVQIIDFMIACSQKLNTSRNLTPQVQTLFCRFIVPGLLLFAGITVLYESSTVYAAPLRYANWRYRYFRCNFL